MSRVYDGAYRVLLVAEEDDGSEVYGFTEAAAFEDCERACGMRRLAFALGGKDYQPIGRAFSIEWEDRPLSLTLQRAGLN